jgi:hypothetical protein
MVSDEDRVDACAGEHNGVAANRVPEGLAELGPGTDLASQLVHVVVEDLDGVAGESASLVGEGGEGGGPRFRVSV